MRTAVCPLPSVAVICTTSVPEASVSRRLASTVFTWASEPANDRVEPLAGLDTMPPTLVTVSVPPFRDVSVTL